MLHSQLKQKIFIILAIVICYGITIQGPFLWDDEEMVVNNSSIKSIQSIQHIFQSSAFGESFNPSKFYRPIQILTYSLDYFMWGMNAAGFHLTNIFLYSLFCIILFHVFKSLEFSSPIPFVGTLFVAIHPLNIECVSYISGRGDVLNLCFSMSCFYFYINYKKENYKKIFFLCCVASYVFGMLSKENMILLPFICLSYDMLKKRSIKKTTALTYTLLALSISYGIWRLLGATHHHSLSWIAEASLFQRFSTLPYIFWSYFKLTIFPYPLHMEYHYVATNFLTRYHFLFGILVGILWYPIYKKQITYRYYFGLIWAVLCVVPVLNIFPPLASTLREHWFSLSLIGVTISTFDYMSCCKLLQKKTAMIFLFLFIIILGGVTMSRNTYWINPKKLYANDSKHEPRSFVLHNNLGVIYYRENNKHLAKIQFYKSIQHSPNKAYDTALNNYGVLLEEEGSVDMAVKYYKKSIDSGQYKLAYHNLSRFYINQKEFSQALNIVNQGLKVYPYDQKLLDFKKKLVLVN